MIVSEMISISSAVVSFSKKLRLFLSPESSRRTIKTNEAVPSGTKAKFKNSLMCF